jgi:hypothetical protein
MKPNVAHLIRFCNETSYMTCNDIEALFQRLGRLVHASQQKRGNGTAWDYKFPDGETHHYIIRNVKSLSDVEDSVSNLLIWIWNSKDYLKDRLLSKGLDPQYVERFIDENHHLSVCGDLANQLKHGRAKKSRSGKFPKLDVAGFSIPQSAIQTLTFRAFEVDVDVGNPDDVEFRIPILDSKGVEFGEVFEYVTAAITGLETLWENIESVSVTHGARK